MKLLNLKIKSMNLTEYKKKAVRTLSNIDDGGIMDQLHMVLGMQTEAAELADTYKKKIAYGKELDFVNIREEIGDLMWYISNLCAIKNWDLEEILNTNIAKLEARYPEKFDKSLALNRDLNVERQILEQ